MADVFKRPLSGGTRAGRTARPGGSGLHDLFRGTSHTLLLFDGAAATPGGYQNLSSISEAVSGRFENRIRSYLIIPRPASPEGLRFDGPVLQDAGSEFHSMFGAETECLYLVRPDGYVGFRCQPALGEPLMKHLEQILT